MQNERNPAEAALTCADMLTRDMPVKVPPFLAREALRRWLICRNQKFVAKELGISRRRVSRYVDDHAKYLASLIP